MYALPLEGSTPRAVIHSYGTAPYDDLQCGLLPSPVSLIHILQNVHKGVFPRPSLINGSALRARPPRLPGSMESMIVGRLGFVSH